MVQVPITTLDQTYYNETLEVFLFYINNYSNNDYQRGLHTKRTEYIFYFLRSLASQETVTFYGHCSSLLKEKRSSSI